MSTEPKPRRIEWAGPESWTVWTDEDGTHLKSARGDCLEMPDVERLFTLWQHARAMATADHIPAPKPPTREQVREEGYWRAEEHAKRRAIRAVEAEFNPPANAPF
jgi:hypothetical protein